MKNIIALFALILTCGAISAQGTTAPASSDGAQIKFETKVLDYGEVVKASNGVREFKFTNTGNAPLEIKHAKGSCGCTVPSHPKEPIMPGESGVISVKYDTKRVGPFTKYVTLTTNSPDSPVKLTIKGKVMKEKDAVPVVDDAGVLTPNQ